MKTGIVGFKGSGKTTLFNALTGNNIDTGYGKMTVNLGEIKVPDKRLDFLSEVDNPEKTTYAKIRFADIPGGSGSSAIDAQTLGKIREMDALTLVIKGFDNGFAKTNPQKEFVSFEEELILADTMVAEKRIERLEKDRSDPRQLELLKLCLEHLGNGRALRELNLKISEKKLLSGFAFLSLKPVLAVLNVSEDDIAKPTPPKLLALAHEKKIHMMSVSAPIENEIALLDSESQEMFLKDLGVAQPAVNRFIKATFDLLNLIVFFTHGEDECRAWIIKDGSNAVDAAGAVHSDLARGFIRAEVIAFKDFEKYKSETACKEHGKFKVEGKNYLVRDGDICHIRFNV